jgi:GAF domain-containing protein/HAMP domain-containing protein
MQNLKIGQKIMIVMGLIFVLFAVGLAAISASNSFNNLTDVKQAELKRMSQILAGRISEMETRGVVTAQSFEKSEPIVNEIKLITDLGPLYADPGSYFAEDFLAPGQTIENADKVFVFESQLKLIQLLLAAQELNNLNTISYYLLSPYDIVPGAIPALSVRVDKEKISVAQFARKGNSDDAVVYQISTDEFEPPAPDYFDISSAYSAPPEQFYEENGFHPVSKNVIDGLSFPANWYQTDQPQSEIVVRNGIPIIQTWYPVKIQILHPQTWQPATVPVGLALTEQYLDAAAVDTLKSQLGLDMGLAQGDVLLVNSLNFSNWGAVSLAEDNPTVNLEQNDYYYERNPIVFSDAQATGMESVVLSPRSELEQLTQNLRNQIVFVTIAAIVVVGLIIYLGMMYLLTRPLGALTAGVQTIIAGNLRQPVPVQSQDELGQLAIAFNGMASQLGDLIDSLENRVAARTSRLEIVASLSERLNAILNIDQLLQVLVTQVKENFDYYHTHVYLLDAEREYLEVAAGYGQAGAQMKAQGHRIRLDASTSLVAQAARDREIVLVDNVRADKHWLPNSLLPDTHSEMAVPIVVDKQVVGVLDVQSDKIAGLDEGDVSVLRSLANQVAVAMNNARLFLKTQVATQEAEALNRRLTREAWQSIDKKVQSTGYVFTKSQVGPSSVEWMKAMDYAVKEKQLIRDITKTGLNGDQLASVAIPLTLRGEVIGVIGLERKNNHTWTEDDLVTLHSISEQVALALDAARLSAETERAAWRDQLVSESTAKVWSSSEFEEVLRTAVAQLGDSLGASEVVIQLNIDSNLMQN